MIAASGSADRVVVTGDVLRPPFASQDENIIWMGEVLRRPVEAGTGLRVGKLEASPWPAVVEQVYRELNLPLNNEGWAALFESPPPASLLDFLKTQLQGAVVVGFELPPILKTALEAVHVPCLELLVHPIRFCSDLLLAMRFSDRRPLEVLRHYAISYEEVRLRAEGIRDRCRATAGITEDGPLNLITVQVPWDRSVIYKGRFSSLLDYRDQLAEVRRNEGRLAVKPHPDIGVPQEVAVWAASEQVAVTTRNFYELMSSGAVSSVVSLSSSTLDEAEAFQIPARRLLPQRSRFFYRDSEQFTPGDYVVVNDAWHRASFWYAALHSFARQADTIREASFPVNLRESRNVFWDWRPGFAG
ncbi:MAG TPA: hypothetical protein VES20_17795 [Bryobacteraceae bacterium]|nr:hypothetical protein [Bryobacteraceae bacterium]